MAVTDVWKAWAPQLQAWHAAYSWVPSTAPAAGCGTGGAAWRDYLGLPAGMTGSALAHGILREVEHRFQSAESVRERAEAVRLVRRWKLQRGLGEFLVAYDDDDKASDLHRRATKLGAELADRPTPAVAARLNTWLRGAEEVWIPVGSTFLAIATPNRRVAVVDRFMAAVWNDANVTRFGLAGAAITQTQGNVRAWVSSQRELEWGLLWLQAEFEGFDEWGARDLEMALFQSALELA